MASIVAPQTNAQTRLTFPIAELENCADQATCKIFCDSEKNFSACISFGEKSNLISKEEADRARKLENALQEKGPGSCTDRKTCEAYCDDVKHIDECLSFAEKNELFSSAELNDARKIAVALKSDGLPGSCSNKMSCELYCTQMAHRQECLDFAVTHELFTPDQITKIQADITNQGTLPSAQQIENEILQQINTALNGIPDSAQQCVKNKMNEAFIQKLNQGQVGEKDITVILTTCINELIPTKETRVGNTVQVPTSVDVKNDTPLARPTSTLSAEMCARFSFVPNCDLVPQEVKSLCVQCKNQ